MQRNVSFGQHSLCCATANICEVLSPHTASVHLPALRVDDRYPIHAAVMGNREQESMSIVGKGAACTIDIHGQAPGHADQCWVVSMSCWRCTAGNYRDKTVVVLSDQARWPNTAADIWTGRSHPVMTSTPQHACGKVAGDHSAVHACVCRCQSLMTKTTL